MKHTPGPWRVEIHDTGTYVTRELAQLQRQSPVSICLINGPCIMVPAPEPEANARLIAAAPELLAALEDLVVVCDELNAREDLPLEFDGSILDRAQAALAKVKQ